MGASISIAGELLCKMSLISQLKNFSYRQYCQALTEWDAIQLDDFGKLSISEHHVIELRYCFTDGVFNPSLVIDYFACYTDKKCNELRELVIKNAKQKRSCKCSDMGRRQRRRLRYPTHRLEHHLVK